MKIACIYHSIDLDGWMSAAIVKHWFITEHGKDHLEYRYNVVTKTTEAIYKGAFDTIKFDYPSITFIGYNYGQPIPDLSEYYQVIMCDISFSNNGEIAQEMLDLFGMNTLQDKRFIWIDHHDSAIKLYYRPGIDYFIHGSLNVHYAACELTWMYFFPDEPIPEIVRLLGRYDCFGHKGTDEERTVLEFQYGARQIINNYKSAYDYLIMSLNHIPYSLKIEEKIRNAGVSIYSYLCTEAKQTYKNGFEIKFEGKPVITSNDGTLEVYPEYKFLAINRERFNPINFGIDYHADGYDGCACFHYANGVWNFSLYNDNGLIDCSVIAKQFGGGGHKGASGFRVKDISKIISHV